MNELSSNVQGPPAGGLLTIGELAEATGVGAATLRAWERRHGFPVPLRLPSGHRRYTGELVDAVLDVVHRQAQGARLDAAVAAVRAALDDEGAGPPPVPGERSVFAALRRRHPQLAPQRLGKPTLLALSWAIEDEFCSRALAPYLFGSFQHDSYFRAARSRWDDLARTARAAAVFADFSGRDGGTPPGVTDISGGRPGGGPARVHLSPGSPLLREWALVCDDDDLPAVLTAWELPGQQDVPDPDRLFDAVWTVDRQAARDASRAFVRVAHDAGEPWAPRVLEELAPDPRRNLVDPATQTALFNRVVAYVDQSQRRRARRTDGAVRG